MLVSRTGSQNPVWLPAPSLALRTMFVYANRNCIRLVVAKSSTSVRPTLLAQENLKWAKSLPHPLEPLALLLTKLLLSGLWDAYYNYEFFNLSHACMPKFS